MVCVVKTKQYAAKRKHQNLLTAGTLEEWTGWDLCEDWLNMKPKDMLTECSNSTVENYELFVPQN